MQNKTFEKLAKHFCQEMNIDRTIVNGVLLSNLGKEEAQKLLNEMDMVSENKNTRNHIHNKLQLHTKGYGRIN